MNWLEKLHHINPVASTVLVFALTAALGIGIGRIKLRGIGLGVAGVLFSGILLGHFGFKVEKEVLEFVRDFGLVLFVYTIGLQLGPGFFTSLRREGLPLNLMAATIVLMGAGIALAISHFGKIDIAAAVGLFSGATTNTPSLGAAQQALRSLELADASRIELPALGYAVAYPFGIIGIILSMIFFRVLFRVDLKRETAEFARRQRRDDVSIERMNIAVTDERIRDVAVRAIPGREGLKVTISRIRRAGDKQVHAVTGDTLVSAGDLLLAVGPADDLVKFCRLIGKPSDIDLRSMSGDVGLRRIVVTRRQALGKSVGQIGFDRVHGVTVTRLVRSGVEMPVSASIRLQFGDVLQVVGGVKQIESAAQEVGDSSKELNHTHFGALFVGICAGILLGLIPLKFPGVPVAVRLGAAGGPLLAAILFSQVGRVGPLVSYMPDNANIALREFGIILFLACVGLKAGGHFFELLLNGDGLLWMSYGSLITVVPLLIVGLFGRLVWKLNFMNLCGLLSGSMTDPPALAFANTTAGSDAPALAYAAVYPLTMLLRIVSAQLLILFFVS